MSGLRTRVLLAEGPTTGETTYRGPPTSAAVADPRPGEEQAPGADGAAVESADRSDDGGGYDDQYRHLAPLLREYAAAAADDPRRASLRARLITGFLPVAAHIARRYAHRGEPLEDLVQVAGLGLIGAIDRFNPDHGSPFLAFAIPTISGEVRRYFRDKAWAMRVPRRLKDLRVSINRVVAELSQGLGRPPRPSEIAARLGADVGDVVEALDAAESYRAESLDELRGAESNSLSLGDMFGVCDPDFDRFTDSHSLAPHLAALPARERNIVLMRFYGEMTQSQIAHRIGISQMHVSRLLSTTLDRLREAVQDNPAPPVS